MLTNVDLNLLRNATVKIQTASRMLSFVKVQEAIDKAKAERSQRKC